MAERRMFAKSVILSDGFMELTTSAKCLYFILGMVADDDGFVNSPRGIMRQLKVREKDLEQLVQKRFLIAFDSGVVAIRHWRVHNQIRKDRYMPTQHIVEMQMLELNSEGTYLTKSVTPECQPNVNHLATAWQPSGNRVATQYSIGKDRLGQVRSGESESAQPTRAPEQSKAEKCRMGEYGHVLLSLSELEKLNGEYGEDTVQKAITYLDEYVEMKGYKVKSHYLAIKKWVIDAVKERENAPNSVCGGRNSGAYGSNFGIGGSNHGNGGSKHGGKGGGGSNYGGEGYVGSFDTDDFFEAAVRRSLGENAMEDFE